MEIKISLTKAIRYFGKTYRNLEEMPPEIRKTYEQAMSSASGADGIHSEKIVIDGQEYASAEEMPSDVRQTYEQARKFRNESNADQEVSSSIIFNGEKYPSVEELPPNVRSSYEQMRAMMKEAVENPEAVEVSEIIVNDKKFSSVEEMPPDLRESYLRAMAASNESPENSLARVIPGHLTKERAFTIIKDHSEKAENASDDTEKPGLGSFLAILVGITVIYLMYLLIPGRHEPWEKFIARQPTWGSFFRGWTFIVLPIASFLWLGFYCFRGRFFDALSLVLKILMAALVVLIIAMILSVVFGW